MNKKKLQKFIFSKLKQFNIKEKINLDSDISSLGLDSLDLMDLVLEIESKFNVRFDDQKLNNIKKIKDIFWALK